MQRTSVCAMPTGGDAARASAGEILLCPEWAQRVGSGERTIRPCARPTARWSILVNPTADAASIRRLPLFPEEPPPRCCNETHRSALPVGPHGPTLLFYRAVSDIPTAWEIPTRTGWCSRPCQVRKAASAAAELSESRQTATGRSYTFAGAGCTTSLSPPAHPPHLEQLARVERRSCDPRQLYEDLAASGARRCPSEQLQPQPAYDQATW